MDIFILHIYVLMFEKHSFFFFFLGFNGKGSCLRRWNAGGALNDDDDTDDGRELLVSLSLFLFFVSKAKVWKAKSISDFCYIHHIRTHTHTHAEALTEMNIFPDISFPQFNKFVDFFSLLFFFLTWLDILLKCTHTYYFLLLFSTIIYCNT